MGDLPSTRTAGSPPPLLRLRVRVPPRVRLRVPPRVRLRVPPRAAGPDPASVTARPDRPAVLSAIRAAMAARIALVSEDRAPQASRLRNRIAPMMSRIAVYTANTANWLHGENRCGFWPPTTAVMAVPAESGSHRTMSSYQLDGSRCARIGITNSSPMIEVMVAAVCRKIDPAANANRPHRVTYSALPITARSTLGPDSEALACVLDSSAWPRKNAMNAASSVTTRATMAKTSALAV